VIMKGGALCVLGFALAACASPSVRLYTLMAQNPVAARPPMQAARSIVIERIDLPEMIDRPQLIVRSGPNRVTALEQERWAEPLREAFLRVVREDLASRLPDSVVQLRSEGPSAKPDVSVTLEIVRFELVPGQHVSIETRGSLTSAHAPAKLIHIVEQVPVRASVGDYDALAGASANALGSLSADLAQAIESAAPADPKGGTR